MSGHSKWATIKRKKGANDAARGKLFGKLVRQVEVAARESGTSDPAASPSLADAIQRARDASVPKDNIERAAKRGAGELDDGVAYTPVTYEGYAPGGVAVLVECLTDNKNRTASDVRQAFTKVGGSLADPGSVAYLFSRRGQIVLAAEGVDEEEAMLAGMEHGLEDLEDQGETMVAWCDPGERSTLRKAFEAAGLVVREASSPLVPSTSIPVADVAEAKKILRLLDLLDDLDDVQDVYANFDIADDVMDEASADA